MPRVKLSPDYGLIIARDSIRKSARQVDIAKILNVDQSTVCRKTKTMNFTMPELVKLVQAGVIEKDLIKKWIDLC